MCDDGISSGRHSKKNVATILTARSISVDEEFAKGIIDEIRRDFLWIMIPAPASKIFQGGITSCGKLMRTCGLI